MLKALAILTLSLLPACSAAPQPVPQLRMTPAELQPDAASNNQIGSSNLPGVHTKVLAGNRLNPGFTRYSCSCPRHDHSSAFASRQSHRNGCLGPMELRLRRPLRRRRVEGTTAGQCLLRAGRGGPLRAPRRPTRSWCKSPAMARPTRSTSIATTIRRGTTSWQSDAARWFRRK